MANHTQNLLNTEPSFLENLLLNAHLTCIKEQLITLNALHNIIQIKTNKIHLTWLIADTEQIVIEIVIIQFMVENMSHEIKKISSTIDLLLQLREVN